MPAGAAQPLRIGVARNHQIHPYAQGAQALPERMHWNFQCRHAF